jgi:hypothetical protein
MVGIDDKGREHFRGKLGMSLVRAFSNENIQ